jgi:uncharacterized damage-inducible protein DinB
MQLDRTFLDAAARQLEMLSGRIVACLDKLDDAQVWFRAAGHENAVGNLVLHLCGNVRQWIGIAAGDLADIRQRDAEFNAEGGLSRDELKERLQTTVKLATVLLGSADAAKLARLVRIQNYEVTGLEAIFNSVQHFGQHAGQIIFITKNLTATEMGFYRHLSLPTHSEKTP